MNSNIYGRIYKNFPLNKLLRLKMFFVMCRFPLFINNISILHSRMSNVLGTKFVNRCVKLFFGDIFIGGENSKELDTCISNLNKEGILCIADYAREFLTKEEEKEVRKIIKIYKESIEIAINNNSNNSVALKVSSLGDVDSIKSLNKIQNALKIIEEGLISNSSFEEVLTQLRLEKLDHHMTKKDYDTIKTILKVEDFTLCIHELLLQRNEALIKIICDAFQIPDKKLSEFCDFSIQLDQRLRSIFEFAESKHILIMIDAEQTYLQVYIDYLVAYYFKIFNKKRCILATTLQCYLKSQPKTLHKFSNFVTQNDLRLGLKIVRGAYLSEEWKLSQELKKENPICNSYEQTNENYNKTIEFIYNNYRVHDKVLNVLTC